MSEASVFPVAVEQQGESVELSLSLHQMAMLMQASAAFGSGAGGMKAATATMESLYNHYGALRNPGLEARWEQVAQQVLERIAATGRLAALRATEAGRASIAPEDFRDAALRVEKVSATTWCPPNKDAQF